MRAGDWVRALAAVALATAAACGGTGGRSPEDGSSPPPKCQLSYPVPEGFEVTENFEDPYPDRVGVRLGFRDQRSRELHYFVGIQGEFGEGLPFKGSLEVSSGEAARLLGEAETWVLAWEATGACGPHAVFGTGFTQAGFMRVMQASGVIVPG